MPNFLSGGFLSGIGGEDGPLKDVRARIEAKVAEARKRMEDMRARLSEGAGGGVGGQMLGQMPRLTNLRNKVGTAGGGGLIGRFGLLGGMKDRYRSQESREPGHHAQDISPTAQEAAIAEDIYSEKLRAESSPGLSVSL